MVVASKINNTVIWDVMFDRICLLHGLSLTRIKTLQLIHVWLIDSFGAVREILFFCQSIVLTKRSHSHKE